MAAGALPSFGEVGADHRVQRGLQHGHPHRGERPAHVGDLEQAEQVGRADAGQFPAAQRAGGGDRAHRVGVAAGRGDQRPGHHGGVRLEQFGPGRTVAVILDHPGRAHQQVRHVGGGAQHVHEPLGHRGLVAQRRQIPGLPGQRLRQAAVGQQPAVGVGGIRHPVQQPGQQHRLHATAPAALVDQRRHVFQRGLRALVAERGELPFGGLRRHAVPDLQARRADRLQQRLVEELGVQLRHPQVLVPQLLAQHARGILPSVGPDVCGAGQPAHRLLILGLR